MDMFAGLEHIVRDAELLAPYTWLRLGGTAEYFAEPTSVTELAELVRRCRENELPIRLLGGGSNLLVRDGALPGLVVHLSAPAFSEIVVRGNSLLTGGGAKLAHAISTAVREGLSGLEPLVGIPGTVGGALHGNSGSQGGDVGQRVRRATVMTRNGAILTRQREDLHFAYRQSSLDELVILDATFELERSDPVELTKRLQTLWIVKKSGEPRGNEGIAMMFRDPGGMSAASIIEQSGLKGTRVGNAAVSEQHANFVVANPGTTSDDVLQLMELVRSRIAEHFGVELETALEIW